MTTLLVMYQARSAEELFKSSWNFSRTVESIEDRLVLALGQEKMQSVLEYGRVGTVDLWIETQNLLDEILGVIVRLQKLANENLESD